MNPLAHNQTSGKGLLAPPFIALLTTEILSNLGADMLGLRPSPSSAQHLRIGIPLWHGIRSGRPSIHIPAPPGRSSG